MLLSYKRITLKSFCIA